VFGWLLDILVSELLVGVLRLPLLLSVFKSTFPGGMAPFSAAVTFGSLSERVAENGEVSTVVGCEFFGDLAADFCFLVASEQVFCSL